MGKQWNSSKELNNLRNTFQMSTLNTCYRFKNMNKHYGYKANNFIDTNLSK